MKLEIALLLACIIITSCSYPKVLISKEEKNYIQIKNRQQFIFLSDKGIKDTLLIYKNYPFGYEPNFDFWWNKRISQNDTITSKRDFGKKFSTYANYENNSSKIQNMNLSVDIFYTKNEFDETMILSIEPFKEKYILKNDGTEQYVFENNDCSETNSYCVNKIVFELKRGIVYVEKGNGDKWNLLSELKSKYTKSRN